MKRAKGVKGAKGAKGNEGSKGGEGSEGERGYIILGFKVPTTSVGRGQGEGVRRSEGGKGE